MHLTRRAFTQAATALAGGAVGGPTQALASLSAVPSAEDAYEALLSSYIAAEQRAMAGRRVGDLAQRTAGSQPIGAATAQGRAVESYLAALDLRVAPLTSARDLITHFKAHVSRERAAALELEQSRRSTASVQPDVGHALEDNTAKDTAPIHPTDEIESGAVPDRGVCPAD